MARTNLKNALLLPAILATLFVAGSGCGNSSKAFEPDPMTARRALESVLAAWQRGEGPEPLAKGSPVIYAVNSQWLSGDAISGYEIVEEEPAGEGNERRFAAILRSKKPGAETRARFVVVGKDPIWVYRGEDYENFLNMGPTARPKASAARR